MTTGEITAYVPFAVDTARALEAEVARSGFNQAQFIDFAVRAWVLLQMHQASGGKVFLQMPDGRMHEVVFEPPAHD
ncbi:hypothetical protein [Actinomadura rudentiformis]|uniref:Ribbon-helix-helix protein, CopG family n=1 Tax=Actinomadura rudentiformis TaxID=359158 RepID=A0A6H9YM55_9ACTN|nr:hypothetical protein [Actinomadura rudentiformis]KAB2340646.1 hypothetical protein F8566_44860 [Actinomadura rudentiformis]